MQFNITFKTIFEYVLKKLVLCIQIRFVSTEKTTRIASRASCYCILSVVARQKLAYIGSKFNVVIYWNMGNMYIMCHIVFK